VACAKMAASAVARALLAEILSKVMDCVPLVLVVLI
jgi:hypothetical protein